MITTMIFRTMAMTMALVASIRLSGKEDRMVIGRENDIVFLSDSLGTELLEKDIDGLPGQTKALVLKLGFVRRTDSAEEETKYEETLFDFPTGHICTMTGRMPRHKRLAVSKTCVCSDNNVGYIYNIVKRIRYRMPDARLFISASDTSKSEQIRRIANMMCIPFAEADMQMVADYAFALKYADGSGKGDSSLDRPCLGKILLLGDSYSEQRRWTDWLERLADVELTNLGVSSATIKDKEDWRTSSYTAFPVRSDNAGNHNTIACQIEKLCRLMEGRNLRKGEKAMDSEYVPDIILLQGGANDNPDSWDGISGRLKDDDRTTFVGALGYLVGRFKLMFPKSKVYVVTPAGLYYGHTDRPFDFIVKAEQMRGAAGRLGISTIDWDRECRLSFVFNNSYGTGNGSASKPFRYDCPTYETRDLLHPNEIGGRYLAETVIKELLK